MRKTFSGKAGRLLSHYRNKERCEVPDPDIKTLLEILIGVVVWLVGMCSWSLSTIAKAVRQYFPDTDLK